MSQDNMPKRTVLIADDTKMHRTMLGKALNEEYNIVFACNGKEALDIVRTQNIDILILDIVMPIIDGYDVIKAMKADKQLSLIPIVVTTAEATTSERKVFELGADEFIHQPFDSYVVKKRVENIIHKYLLQVEIMTGKVELAEKANKAKSEFLSVMSHDIRTPLNAIINLSALARNNINDTKMLRADLDKIMHSSNFLLSLINDILDMSRIESGLIALEPHVYTYEEFKNYIYSVIEPLCAKKDISFEWHSCGRFPDLYIDGTRFNQVMFNILSNAVKYTNPGGKVTLTEANPLTLPTSLEMDFIINDNGRGMSDEFQKKLFMPFEREDNSEAYNGTGLGLSIVKAIIDKMGGTIEVKSKLGEGTTVQLHCTLALATLSQSSDYHSKLKAETSIYSRNDSSKLAGKRILVVEDHPLNQEIVCRLLQKQGLLTECVNNGQKAVDIFEERPKDYYNAILMDIRMPVMNGIDATKAIRLSKKQDALTIPIIAMTANAFADDILESVSAGMDAYLTKPLNASLLISTLNTWLQNAKHTVKSKVIVADDIEVNATIVAESLRSQYDVLLASNGKEALTLLKENKGVVAVITDLQMPIMNGLELIKAIRNSRVYDRIAVLANTNFGDASQEEVLLDLGADDFIYKPTTPKVLCTRLENVLLRHRLITR